MSSANGKNWRNAMSLGPIEMLVVKFPGNQFSGDIYFDYENKDLQ